MRAPPPPPPGLATSLPIHSPRFTWLLQPQAPWSSWTCLLSRVPASLQTSFSSAQTAPSPPLLTSLVCTALLCDPAPATGPAVLQHAGFLWTLNPALCSCGCPLLCGSLGSGQPPVCVAPAPPHLFRVPEGWACVHPARRDGRPSLRSRRARPAGLTSPDLSACLLLR